jgi:hypothetical protein
LNKKNFKKNSKENLEKKSRKNNESNLNCSSSSSGDSSTNLNHSDRLPTPSKSTTQTFEKNDLAFSTKLSQSWTIPNEGINDQEEQTASTPKSKSPNKNHDDDYLDYIKLNKFNNGGISFDFLINKDTNEENNPSNYPKAKPVLTSSISTPMTRRSSEFTNATSLNDSLNTQLTLTKKFEMASNKERSQMRHSITSNDESSTPLNSAKSTNVSLGTRIQSKAIANKDAETRLNSSLTDTSSNVTSSSTNNSYVNRALFLRQQSAKAKLSQDNSKSQSASSSSTPSANVSNATTKPKTNSILKKVPSSLATKSTTNLSITSNGGKPVSKKSVSSRASSRNTSPSGESNSIYRNYSNNDRSLMTTSLNLPSGSTLPSNNTNNLNAAYQRRKNYDPLRAVEQEKLKKTQKRLSESSKHDETNNLANNSMSALDDDQSSDYSYSSLSIPTQKLTDNVSNKQVCITPR